MAPALARVLDGDDTLPISRLQARRPDLVWLVDEALARATRRRASAQPE
jgi:hypothetical protein